MKYIWDKQNEIILSQITVSDFAKSDLVVGYCLTALLYVESYIDNTQQPKALLPLERA